MLAAIMAGFLRLVYSVTAFTYRAMIAPSINDGVIACRIADRLCEPASDHTPAPI
jgi:hypothetical protein